MKRSLLTLILAFIVLASACTNKNFQEKQDALFYDGDRTYHIVVYSGGKVIIDENFKGIVHPNDRTNGIYYFKNDTLKEIKGDYIITSIK